MSMLHIVNGDSVGKKLQQGVVEGDIWVWREVYSHGPVFLDSAAPDNRSVRAQYLEQTLGIPQTEYIQISEAQEKSLADVFKYKEIVLWFEHDLFDQAMLCYLLHRFSAQPELETKLRLLCIGAFAGIDPFRGLGQLSVEQMTTLVETWKPIGAKELDVGNRLWQAYTSPSPELLQQLLNADTSVLPFAHAAFQAHLSRFPSTQNGLGIVEQTTLEMLHTGITSPFELFDQVGNKLHTLGMGDLEYWHILRKMSQTPYPLLQINGPTEIPAYHENPATFGSNKIIMTELGKNVWDGQEDWALKKQIDEWYGGVHLQGEYPRWRWDSSRQLIVES